MEQRGIWVKGFLKEHLKMETEVVETRRVKKEREKDMMIAKVRNWKDKKKIMARRKGLDTHTDGTTMINQMLVKFNTKITPNRHPRVQNHKAAFCFAVSWALDRGCGVKPTLPNTSETRPPFVPTLRSRLPIAEKRETEITSVEDKSFINPRGARFVQIFSASRTVTRCVRYGHSLHKGGVYIE
ncbi:hypothetical protein WN51_08183 [Melipona quadrifasciata]|uniref:Uncharacterized protein n=1 Tax=Melipona quadrifasciata TaxID=166423 RepID=A0A0M8ZRF1_9HYME|nr:hypothetical protein WN51_08183 [Melipona quadrifasciata]